MSAFEELGLCPELISALQDEDWLLPTPIQFEAIPLILGGGDVCAAAETGSGKTGAFGLPCVQIVHEIIQAKAMVAVDHSKSNIKKDVLLNSSDKDPPIFVFRDGKSCASTDDSKWNGIRANIDVFKGKYMFEVSLIEEGLIRIGWALSHSSRILGKDEISFGYGGTGMKSWNNKFEPYGQSYNKGDTIGCAIDRTTQTISYYKNGKFLGEAFSIPIKFHNSGFLPGICGKKFKIKVNFDNLEFPIQDYKPLNDIKSGDFLFGMDIHSPTLIQSVKQRGPICLIFEPTRDLAQQTYTAIKSFASHLFSPSLNISLFVGGLNEKEQRQSLNDRVDICVGTLSKIKSFIDRGNLLLNNIQLLVLDEADDIIKSDNNNDLQIIVKMIKSKQKLQILFFSATLHSDIVKKAINNITNTPTWVDQKGKPTIPDTVYCCRYLIEPDKFDEKKVFQNKLQLPNPPTDNIHQPYTKNEKERNSFIIKSIKPKLMVLIANELKMTQCLVFCRTNLDCDNLEKYLISLGGSKFSGKAETGKENPYSCVVLAGMKDQNTREANLEHFKQGDVRFLICTDVAARGLDIQALPFLIMMTLPDDVDLFFHRVGRVGRADKMGLAISLVSHEEERVWYHQCVKRGIGCNNTKLLNEGGCTIWYNEYKYLKNIETQLMYPIPKMDNFTLAIEGLSKDTQQDKDNNINKQKLKRTEILDVKKTDNSESMNISMFGKLRNDPINQATKRHVTSLYMAVEELSSLEVALQHNFYLLNSI